MQSTQDVIPKPQQNLSYRQVVVGDVEGQSTTDNVTKKVDNHSISWSNISWEVDAKSMFGKFSILCLLLFLFHFRVKLPPYPLIHCVPPYPLLIMVQQEKVLESRKFCRT